MPFVPVPFDFPEWKFPFLVKRVLYAPDGRHLLVLGFNGVVYVLRLPAS